MIYNESKIHDGLLSRVSLQEKQIAYTDIANEDILSKRTEKDLDQCVPFNDIYTIFVPNEDVKNQVELLVKSYSTQVRVVSSLFTK